MHYDDMQFERMAKGSKCEYLQKLVLEEVDIITPFESAEDGESNGTTFVCLSPYHHLTVKTVEHLSVQSFEYPPHEALENVKGCLSLNICTDGVRYFGTI